MNKKKYIFFSCLLFLMVFISGSFTSIKAVEGENYVEDFFNWSEANKLHKFGDVMLEQKELLNARNYNKSLVAWFGDNIDIDIVFLWLDPVAPETPDHTMIRVYDNGSLSKTIDNGYTYSSISGRYVFNLDVAEKNAIKKAIFTRDYLNTNNYIEIRTDGENRLNNDFQLIIEVKFKLGLNVTFQNVSMMLDVEELFIPDHKHIQDTIIKLRTYTEAGEYDNGWLFDLEIMNLHQENITAYATLLSYNFRNLTAINDISLVINQEGSAVSTPYNQGIIRLYEISFLSEQQIFLYDYDIPELTPEGFDFNIFEQKICEGFDLQCIAHNLISGVSYTLFKVFDSSALSEGFSSFFNSLLIPFTFINNAPLRSILMILSGLLPIFILIKVWRRLT